MTRYYMFGLFLLLTCSLLEALPRPTNNEETTILPFELTTVSQEESIEEKEERSLMYEETTDSRVNTKDIVDKIKAINDAIKRPYKRPQVNWNTQPQTEGTYIMDKEVLEKLQQIIASGKLQSYNKNINLQDNNLVPDDYELFRQSKQMAAQRLKNQMSPIMSMPYLTSLPVLVMPSSMPINNVDTTSMTQFSYENGYNSMQYGQPGYQTRQSMEGSSSPFQFQWPFANWFPILIRDPLLSILNGGGWNNFIETGQSADICRRQKSTIGYDDLDNMVENQDHFDKPKSKNSREGRAIKKRTIFHQTQQQQVDVPKKTKKIFSKPFLQNTQKPVKQAIAEPDTKTEEEGDLRFGEFSLFGNKRPVAPSPGFFINRLKVKRGGVAIAGPGGISTAGRGGTAIVGPGGLAYTQPGGLAVAGPAARVIALAPDADLSSIITRLQAQNDMTTESGASDEETEEDQTYIDSTEAATQYLPFYGGAKGQYLEIKKNAAGAVTSEKIISEDKISSENIFKNSEDNLLSKVFAANLQSLRTVSNNILKLHTLGRKTGRLGNTENNRFRSQLAALGEAASNTIKLIEEIGDNVDILFKKNTTNTRKYGGFDEDDENDDVGEEGVGIDADGAGGSVSSAEYSDDSGTVAEAKPIGLAVIGDHGLAVSRPKGTAVATSGIALAHPIATAIAGINPAELGIKFQTNK